MKPEEVRAAVAEHRPLAQVEPEAPRRTPSADAGQGRAADARSTARRGRGSATNPNLIARPGRTSSPFHTLALAATSTAPASRIQPDRPGCSAIGDDRGRHDHEHLDDARADVARRPALRRGRGAREGPAGARSSTRPAANTSSVAAEGPPPARRDGRGSTGQRRSRRRTRRPRARARGPASGAPARPGGSRRSSRPALTAAAPPSTSAARAMCSPWRPRWTKPARATGRSHDASGRATGISTTRNPARTASIVMAVSIPNPPASGRTAARHAAVNARCPESGASARKPRQQPDRAPRTHRLHRAHAAAGLRREDRDRHVRPPRPHDVEQRAEARRRWRPGQRRRTTRGRRAAADRSAPSMAPPFPACPGIRSTVAPAASAAAEVASDEPSSTTTTSSNGEAAERLRPCGATGVLLVARGHEGDDPRRSPVIRRWEEPRDAVLHAVVAAGAVRERIVRVRAPWPTRRSAGRRCRRSRAARRTSRPRVARRSVTKPSSDARLSPAPETTPASTRVGHERLHEQLGREADSARRPLRRRSTRPSGRGHRCPSTSSPRCPAPTR